MVYVGMDVHRKRTQLSILEEDGTEVLNRNVPNDPAELNAILGMLEPGTPAVGGSCLARIEDTPNVVRLSCQP